MWRTLVCLGWLLSSGLMWEQEKSKIPTNRAKAIAPLDSSSKTHIDCVSGDTWQFLRIKNISLSCLNRICQLFVFLKPFCFWHQVQKNSFILATQPVTASPVFCFTAMACLLSSLLLRKLFFKTSTAADIFYHTGSACRCRWQRHNQLFVFLFYFFYRKQKHDLKNFSFALWYVLYKGNALKIPYVYKRRKENEFCFSLIIPCGARSYARRSVWSFCFYLSFSPITGNACGQDKSLLTWKYSSSFLQPTANSVSPARPRSTEECFGELYDCPLAYSFLLHISISVTYLTSVRVFLS